MLPHQHVSVPANSEICATPRRDQFKVVQSNLCVLGYCVPYYFESIVILFLGTGHNESKNLLLLRYFLGFSAFNFVIFDFTPLRPTLPRYLEKVRCEPEGQFDIFHSKRDGT